MCGLAEIVAVLAFLVFPGTAQQVSFSTQDGGMVYALVYGAGERGVVLAHGGQFNKESWDTQAQALAASGFRVLAFDFRGYGDSRGPQDSRGDKDRKFDVLAAVRYLRATGAKSVSVVGASMGGDHAAEAAEAEPESIDRLVLLAAGAYTTLSRMHGPKLFILCRDDVMGAERIPRLPTIREQFEKASGPKRMIILEGSAHAQKIFATDQGDRLMRDILQFLSTQ